MLVWDNLNTRISAAMAEIMAARPWLTGYRLPPYAHELNPVEPVWSQLERSLANLAKHTITEPTALVKSRLKRMQSAQAAGRLPRQHRAQPRTLRTSDPSCTPHH